MIGYSISPISEVMRADIRDILHTVIYHPVNDNVPLSELVDDAQVETLANYVGSHDEQRHILIHTLIGNDLCRLADANAIPRHQRLYGKHIR